MPALTSYLFGGIACMGASFFTNPIDVVKTRLQIRGSGGSDGGSMFLYIMRNEGYIRPFFRGLSASMLRETIYSTIRIGAYENIKEIVAGNDKNQNVSLTTKIAAGVISGAIGSGLANPTDLLKVKLQAMTTRSKLNVFQLGRQIYLEEGIKGLYRGAFANMIRSAVLTSSQLASYDHAKTSLLKTGYFEEGLRLHVVASILSGFVCATLTSPVDVVKSRYMADSKKYSSAWDCTQKTMRIEGPKAFFKGWTANWIRLGPHTILTFIFLEKLRLLAGMKPF